MTARELLDIAADYAEARQVVTLNPDMFTEAEGNQKLNELAARFESGLASLER